jgi:site-specific DNA recombinase
VTLSAQNQTKTKPLAAIYIRVSTEEQVREGFSLAAQEDTLKNYSSALGYEIYKVYKDEGKSAKDIKHRPAMNQLLEDAENKHFSAIFIYKLDRFSRSLKDLILTIEKLKEWGIGFVSLQDKIETASASGKLMFHIISAFAEFERNIIGERTTFGMERKSKEGGMVTKPPLGYKMIDKLLVVNLEKADQVKRIYGDFLNSNLSLNKLSKKHNLTINGLKKLLQNRTYLGEVKFAGKTNKGIHKPIMDEKIFKQVQEKLENEGYTLWLHSSKEEN